MGVCLTKVLLVKVVSGALTLLTVLTKFVDEGELGERERARVPNSRILTN